MCVQGVMSLAMDFQTTISTSTYPISKLPRKILLSMNRAMSSRHFPSILCYWMLSKCLAVSTMLGCLAMLGWISDVGNAFNAFCISQHFLTSVSRRRWLRKKDVGIHGQMSRSSSFSSIYSSQSIGSTNTINSIGET